MVETKRAPLAATFVDKMEKKFRSFVFARKVWKIIHLIIELTHYFLIYYPPPLQTQVIPNVLFIKTSFLFTNILITL